MDQSFEEIHEADLMKAALDEALGDDPRAAELLRMSAILVQRRAFLAEELDKIEDPKERAKLEKELKKLEEGARVLLEEANINQFVEDAVRVGIEMRKMEN